MGSHISYNKQDKEKQTREQVWKVEKYSIFYNFFVNRYDPSNYRKMESLTVLFDENLFSTPKMYQEQENNINDILNASQILFPENLSELKLDFTCCSYLEDKTVANIIKGLPRDLKTLDLNLFNCMDISDKCLELLSLYGPKTLQSLRINLGDCCKLTNKALVYIIQYINQLHKLNQLDLSFQWCQKITNTSFQNLINSFPHTQLKRIRLNFQNCGTLNGSSIKALQKYVKQTSLEKINFNFSDCNLISLDSIKSFLNDLPNDYQECKIDFSQVQKEDSNDVIQKKQDQYYEQRRKYSIGSQASVNSESVESQQI